MLVSKLLFFLFLFSVNTFAKEALPTLETKQALSNIRFISHDGKYTYYQKSSGGLNLETNLKVSSILENDAWTEYNLTSSFSKKRITLEVIENFHTNYDQLMGHKLYILNYGGSSVKEIGYGVTPKLHLDDSFISFYNPTTKTVIFKDITLNKEYRVSINKSKNPYFIPDLEMLSRDYAFYTDIKENMSYVFSISLLGNKIEPIYKTLKKETNLEICILHNNLYVLEYPFESQTMGTTITQIPLFNNDAYKKQDIIYSSSLSDLGHLLCKDENLYFIKTITNNEKLNLKESEVAKLNLKTNKLTIETELKRVNELINMDGRILVPLLGKYYLLEGKNNLKTQTLERAK